MRSIRLLRSPGRSRRNSPRLVLRGSFCSEICGNARNTKHHRPSRECRHSPYVSNRVHYAELFDSPLRVATCSRYLEFSFSLQCLWIAVSAHVPAAFAATDIAALLVILVV